MRVFYTKPYLVSDLEWLHKRWFTEGQHDCLRQAVVEATDGHSPRDRVSPRLENERMVRLFEALADKELSDREVIA